MPAVALIKFVQGSTIGPNGQMMIGSLGNFTVQNSDNTGVLSWQIDLIYVPPGSVISPASPFAFNDNNSTPTATILADVTGSWRCVLKVWDVLNRSGAPKDTDIRVFGIREARHGTLVPCPQGLPRPINESNPLKPNEFNLGGNPNGWAGDGADDGFINDTLRKLDAGVFDGLPVGSAPKDGFVVVWNNITNSYVLTPRNGLSITSFSHSPTTLLEWGTTLATPAFTASYSTPPDTAILTNSVDSESVDASAHPTTMASAHNFTNTVVNASMAFFLDATLLGTPSVRATLGFSWGQNVRWGAAVPGAGDAAFGLALPSVFLQTGRGISFTVTAGAGQKIYYFWPTRLGTAVFTVGGFVGGFVIISTTLSVTNSHGMTENYTLAETVASGLGTTLVNVS